MAPIKINYFLSIPILIFIIAAVLVIVFVPGQEKSPVIPQQLESLVTSKVHFDLSGTDARYGDNIAYDNYTETVFDVYIPKSDNPVPVVIFFHSGALFGGNRKDVQEGVLAETVSTLLKGGVAVVSADYRMYGTTGNPLPISLQIEDCRNLIQYLLDSAKLLGINPDRVALSGEGFGGGIALWFAVQQGAESMSADSLLAAASRNGPASFDPEVWTAMDRMFSGIADPDSYIRTLAPESMLDIFKTKDSVLKLDMLSMITPDTPPIWVQNTVSQYKSPETVAEILQHPAQAYALRMAMTEAGLREHSVWYLEADTIKDSSCETMADFFIRRLVTEKEAESKN
ncbi:MAG: alpha/beta hydrolase [Spirochaetes bacterium]|nr:alpha/beta hydrolase [Spirochaetota bacterium]